MIKNFSLALLLFTTASYGAKHQVSDKELKEFKELSEVERLIHHVTHTSNGYSDLNTKLKDEARKHVNPNRKKWDSPVDLDKSGKDQSADILKVNLLISKTMMSVYRNKPQ